MTDKGRTILLALGVAGCSTEKVSDVADVVARSERVVVYSDVDRALATASVTARDLEVLDQYVACVESYFDMSGASKRRYEVLLNEDIEAWSCPTGVPGCYGDKARVVVVDFSSADTAILEIGDTVRHELVHAVAHRSQLRAPWFFEEGRAAHLAYACGPQLPNLVLPATPDYTPDFDAVLAEPAEDAYFSARKVVAELWPSAEGRALIERMSRDLSKDAAPEKVRSAYFELGGEDIEDTWDRVGEVAQVVEPRPRLEASAVKLSPEVESLEVTEDVMRLMADAYVPGWGQAQRAVTLPSAGTYRVRVTTTAASADSETVPPRVLFAPISCEAADTAFEFEDGVDELLQLEACDYGIDVLGQSGSAATLVFDPTG